MSGTAPILELDRVTKRFGGLTAVSSASFTVRTGEILGIIGPNGAGKTTLFNVVSGYYRPESGRVLLAGQDVTGQPPHAICRRGLTRTFQLVKPFGNLSVIDNVMIGALTRLPTVSSARLEAERVVEMCGLTAHAGGHARTLPIGLRKRLEVARALATRPRLLLLDEVMAGLNPTELAGIIELIRRLHADGLTLIVIEHIMAAMMRLAQRIVVLHHGEVIARAPPPRSRRTVAWSTRISARSSCLLKLEGIDAFYGDLQALADVSLEVRDGEIVALVGANAAGKSTTLRVISGLVAPRRGRVLLDDADLAGVPAHRRVERGIVQVPEGRRLFPFMTVAENLMLGAHADRARPERERTLAHIYELFPVLGERRTQLAGSLSGGEQQMCAMGRALMARPQILMLDEPTLGLAPVLVARIFETVRTINRQGVSVLLVEQNVRQALALAHRACVLESGRLVLEGQARELLGDDRLKRAYLGL